jgi:hypothetical protein
MYKVTHELFHTYSFNSVTQHIKITGTEEDGEKEISSHSRRIGLSMDAREDRMTTYLTDINEALTVELEKMFGNLYFGQIPDLKDELEIREQKIAWQKEHHPEKNWHEDIEDIVITPNEEGKGERWSFHFFSYKKQRELLNTIIDDIHTYSSEFKSRDEVFNMFAQGYFTGRILSLARVINDVYKDRPIPGIETEETIKERGGKRPFSVLAEATKATASQ